jgi:hypothetical protein
MPTVSMQPLVIRLPPDRLERLIGLLTAPNPRRRTGYQSKLARWLAALDVADRTLSLTGADAFWLRKQLINRRNGGWQHGLHKVFRDLHPHFANLPHRPWPKRQRKRKRGAT